MNALVFLTSRNNKVYRRDRTLVFFSFLAVIIVIMLYAVFLQKTQVDAIQEVVGSTTSIKSLVNDWMVSGLLSITAVTTTLGAFGIMVKDRESKRTYDLLTAPLSRATIQLSYVLNSFMIGLGFTLLSFVCCELFLVLTGSEILSFSSLFKVIGIIILSVALSSAFNLFFVLFISSQNAFATLNTIIGTAIGFLCGVYVPIGAVPSFVQQIIMYFPISHTAVLFRQVFMEDSLQSVFQQASTEAIIEYKKNFGVVYEMNNHVLSASTSIWIISITTIVITVVSVLIFKSKNK